MSRLLVAAGACSAGLTLGALIGACGGSSSETPFPLEPDPRELAAGAPRPGRYAEQDQERAESDEADEAGRAAPSTWGSGRPKPLPAPDLDPEPELTPEPVDSDAAPAKPAP